MRLAPALLLLLAAALFVGACSDDSDGEAGVATKTPNLFPSQAAPQQQPVPAQPVDATITKPVDGVIEVTLGGILFAPNNLHVPLDDAVEIRITNNDPVPHTMRIAGIDGRYDTEDDAFVPAISGLGVDMLTYAGAAAGSYTFRCDLHPGTMGGVVVVD